jgi:hypothetical protein
MMGDVVQCDFCGNEHEVIGHIGGMALVVCEAIAVGTWGSS